MVSCNCGQYGDFKSVMPGQRNEHKSLSSCVGSQLDNHYHDKVSPYNDASDGDTRGRSVKLAMDSNMFEMAAAIAV